MRKVSLSTLMMILAGVYLIFIFIIFSEIAYGFDLPTDFNRPYQDVNKTWTNDENMCGAAVVANMVAFASGTNVNAKQLYDILVDHFKDRNKDGITLWQGMKYISSKINKGMDFHNTHFYQSLSYSTRTDTIHEWIVGALLQREIVGIAVKLSDDLSHGLTVYGFDYDDGHLVLYIVDSDDKQTKMKAGILSKENDKHILNLVYNNTVYAGQITSAVALTVMP